MAPRATSRAATCCPSAAVLQSVESAIQLTLFAATRTTPTSSSEDKEPPGCDRKHTSTLCVTAIFDEKSSADDVAEWAQREAGITSDAAQRLRENELDGAATLGLAQLPAEKIQDKLVSDGLSRGAAVKLATALSALHGQGD